MKRNRLCVTTVACVLTSVFVGCALQPNSPGTSDDGNGGQVDTGNGGQVDTGNQPDATNDNLVVFADPDSTFSTTSVRDVDEQIVRFDGVAKTMIWVAGDVDFTGWDTDGNFLGAAKMFQVRFGTVSGEPRAYFTETGPATICDIEVVDGMLSISPTLVAVPMN